jgi:hypothetical protein
VSPTRPSKHTEILPDLGVAASAPAKLRAAGHTETADAVQSVLDYAAEQSAQMRKEAQARKATNRALFVTEDFRTWVHAEAAREGAKVADVVKASLQDFLDGDWTPPKVPRTSAEGKVALNVRVDSDLWTEANTLGKDPAAVKARGYTVTASSASIAALEARFGQPGQHSTT